MKKLVLILAVAFGASMVACSSSEKANEENAETTTNETENIEAPAPATADTVWVDEAHTAYINENGDTIKIDAIAVAVSGEETPAAAEN